jgi:Domain of unknown function (DUF4440)
MAIVEFDAEAATDRLQDAVRRHDRGLLDQLISERFALASGRSLGRLGKKEWIAAGLNVEWKNFVISIARVIEISDVVIVDHDIEQDMEASPDWAADAPTHARWITTDVWVAEDGEWRLVCRHPELRQ